MPVLRTDPRTRLACTWTDRDEQILETLALKCRVLTREQIVGHWWPDGSDRGRRRLKELVHSGLLDRYRVNAHPILPLATPVFVWQPGEPAPDTEQLSAVLRGRWNRASTSHIVYTASLRTARLFGRPLNKTHLPRAVEMTHDLHVGQTYLFYRLHHPELTDDWIGEDLVPQAEHGVKEPDAFLINAGDVRYRVVEFGGRYHAARVAEFHGHCFRYNLAYELW